ncbi:MAG: tetratricopeptide repeat protein [Deltaproteobacteria bacterium]|nr:tetratricopeptide repeat protein [Deltaproteobacteria bacterium]
MRKNYGTVAICTLLILFSVSCSSKEMRKREAEPFRNLGEGYIAQGNYSAALRELLKAEKLYPEDAILHNDLGYTYMAKGKLDLAVQHYKKALKINPDYAAARNNLGTAYLKKRDWDAAIAVFEENLENLIYATPQKTYLNLGIAYAYKKEYEISEKYFRDCLNLYRDGLRQDSTYILVLYGLGKLYTDTGRIPEAIPLLEAAIKADPSHAFVYFSLARTCVLSKDQEANKILRQLETEKK